jgi:hypothetical protein
MVELLQLRKDHENVGESLQRVMTMAMAILALSKAKFWPMQILGPQPNGKNLSCPFVDFEKKSCECAQNIKLTN